MIALTTCRRPSRNVRAFARELSYSIPNVLRFNRGKLGFNELIKKLRELNADRLILIYGWKGDIGKIEFVRLHGDELKLLFPIIFLAGVKLRRQHRLRRKFVAQVVTFERGIDEVSLRLVKAISKFFKFSLRWRKLSNIASFFENSGSQDQSSSDFSPRKNWGRYMLYYKTFCVV